ncbi:MAG: Hsp70 family protein, partial [Bacilli bacterium]
FTDSQRKATKMAGELAGFKVDRIINEPTAAAIAFCHGELEKNQNILVYDLGGGTFDVSVVEVFEGVLEVKATTGDNHLGGSDFDNILIELLKAKFEDTHGFPITDIQSNKEMLFYTLKEMAEDAKIALSSQQTTDCNQPYIGMKDGLPVGLDCTITRAEFEDAIRTLVDSTFVHVDKAIAESGLTVSDLDEILLVGGSTRIPLVRSAVEERYKKKVRVDINPDEVVALGAAYQGAIKSGEIDSKTGMMVVDICPYTLGTDVRRLIDGVYVSNCYDPMIPKNSVLPISVTKGYQTAYDNQTMVSCKVYQGDGEYTDDVLLISEGVELHGIPQAKAGVEKMDVTFSYDINGLLQVEATLRSTGHTVRKAIQWQPGVMSDREFIVAKERLEEESQNAELYADVKLLITRAEKVKKDASERDRTAIEAKVQSIKAAIADGKPDEVRVLEEELTDLLIALV